METRLHTERRAGNFFGFSTIELLSTVAVIGILSSIMITVMSNVKDESADVIANEVKETVNLGVKKFSQIGYTIKTASDHNSAADETAILGLLQTRDITLPGSPFVRPDWNPVASSSEDDYRIDRGELPTLGKMVSDQINGEISVEDAEKGTTTGCVALSGRTVYIEDFETDPDYAWKTEALAAGFRSSLGVPLIKDGVTVGVISLTHSEIAASYATAEN